MKNFGVHVLELFTNVPLDQVSLLTRVLRDFFHRKREKLLSLIMRPYGE